MFVVVKLRILLLWVLSVAEQQIKFWCRPNRSDVDCVSFQDSSADIGLCIEFRGISRNFKGGGGAI